MLETLDLKEKLSKPAYTKRIRELEQRLRRLPYAAQEAELPIIVCLEGLDTSGRGQVIKKLTERLDPRLYRIFPGRPPSELELRYHFLWRYRGEYSEAVEDMLRHTRTLPAPWRVVEANNKYYAHARVRVLRTVVDALDAALN